MKEISLYGYGTTNISQRLGREAKISSINIRTVTPYSVPLCMIMERRVDHHYYFVLVRVVPKPRVL